MPWPSLDNRFGRSASLWPLLAILLVAFGFFLSTRENPATSLQAPGAGWINEKVASLLAGRMVEPPARWRGHDPHHPVRGPLVPARRPLHPRRSHPPHRLALPPRNKRPRLVPRPPRFPPPRPGPPRHVFPLRGRPLRRAPPASPTSSSCSTTPPAPPSPTATKILRPPPTPPNSPAPPAHDEPARLDVARGWLLRDQAALLDRLRQDHKVRLYTASNGARLLAEIESAEQLAPAIDRLKTLEAAGAESRLGDSLSEVLTELRGAPPTAVLYLTDGQTTAGEPLARAAEDARAKRVPIFPVGLGDPSPTRDLELTDLQVDDVVFVDDPVRFEARLAGRGFAGESVAVKLRRRPADQEDPAAFQEIERVQVTVPPDGQPERVEIRHRPTEVGAFVYELVVDTRPRELQTDNNQVARPVNVREEKVKVLLVEGEPRYEFRYLLSFLKRDKTIDLRTVLQSSDPEYAEQEVVALPTFPTARDGPEGLFEYDVVVFGDVDPSFLSAVQMANLAEFVEQKGGGVLFVAGQGFNPISYKGTPLEPLLPIRLSEARDPAVGSAGLASFRPALTAEGRSHPIFRFAEDDTQSTARLGRPPPPQLVPRIPPQARARLRPGHPSLPLRF